MATTPAQTFPRGPYRDFHPCLKVFVSAGNIPQSIREKVPSSTWSTWLQTDFSNSIGSELFAAVEGNQGVVLSYLGKPKFRIFVNASHRLLVTLEGIHKGLRGFKTRVKSSKKQVVSVIAGLSKEIPLKALARIFGISVQTYHRWKRHVVCPSSIVGYCRRLNPSQLTKKEIAALRKVLANPPNPYWRLINIYYDMLRRGLGFMCPATFYDYAKILGFSSAFRPIKKKRYPPGIRSARPFQLLHVDFMRVKITNGVTAYIHVLKDNFSRAILAALPFLSKGEANTVELFKSAASQHPGMSAEAIPVVLSDGGSENNIISSLGFRHLVAGVDITSANNMVEAGNKTLRYDYILIKPPASFSELALFLPEAIFDYNNRPHSALLGHTPSEVLGGAVPDRKMFQAQIHKAQQKRLRVNMAHPCKPLEIPPCQ